MKLRKFPENNYLALYDNGKTYRFYIDDDKELTGPKFPEFYDVKITGKCQGNCPYCYMDSKDSLEHYDCIKNIRDFFGKMTLNQRPFQVALGGGNPNYHPQFIEILKEFINLGIVPNYTTNGMNLTPEIYEATKEYCGGVAVSCHPHLQEYWQEAVFQFLYRHIHTNLHIIISDRKSVDEFFQLYEQYHKKVKYFVLLPYEQVGRAEKKPTDFKYLLDKLELMQDISDVAFGANFYEDLKGREKLPVSLYEPEMFSKFLDMRDMNLYFSSFKTDKPLMSAWDLFKE